MSDIPSHCFWEILTRVPAKPLPCFRCVCKTWRNIIDDPDFIKSHLLRQNESGHLLIRNSQGTKLHTISLNSLYYTNSRTKTVWAEPVKTLISLGVPRLPALPVSSCDGLILISHYDIKKIWAVWNPFTQESLELPSYEDDTCVTRGGMARGGIGYDRVSDDYKVVRIAQFYDPKPKMETLVYNMKLDYWRRIQDFPNCTVPWQGHGVFVNGALHWVTCVKQQRQQVERIIAFDLGTETYSLLPLPSLFYEPNHQKLEFDQYLDMLDGCLFMSCCYWIKRLDGWMMNDYGGTNTWTKFFSLTDLDVIGGMGVLRPIAYLKSEKQILLQHDGEEFFWFDVEKKSANKVTICGAPNYFSTQVFPASLVRLNTCVDGSAAVKPMAKGKKKKAKDGLKLILTTSNVWKFGTKYWYY